MSPADCGAKCIYKIRPYTDVAANNPIIIIRLFEWIRFVASAFAISFNSFHLQVICNLSFTLRCEDDAFEYRNWINGVTSV